MALPQSGPLWVTDILNEFDIPEQPMMLSDLYRGGAFIRAKSPDNTAVDLAASVPASGPLSLSSFYGTAKGFKYTISASLVGFEAHPYFGSDWNVDWPKLIEVDPGVVVGGQPGVNFDYAMVVHTIAKGRIELINYGEIQGFGGAANSGGGGHAIHFNTDAAIGRIKNYGAIRSGGGGGGHGGAGGQGGPGYYTSGTTEGPHYSGTAYVWRTMPGTAAGLCWGGTWFLQGDGRIHTETAIAYGGYTYYKGALMEGSYFFAISRSNIAYHYTSGGAGGAGGGGGQGRGYGQAPTTGAAGSGGGAPGTNAGWGGTGGTGGTGGEWGQPGAAGGNGLPGGAGNNGGGAAGAAGAAGGAPGYSVYAPAGLNVAFDIEGIIQGPRSNI